MPVSFHVFFTKYLRFILFIKQIKISGILICSCFNLLFIKELTIDEIVIKKCQLEIGNLVLKIEAVMFLASRNAYIVSFL